MPTCLTGRMSIHHVLYSDFDEVASLGGLHSLVNALEDVRIDAIGYKKYPGGYLWRNEHFSKMARAGQLPKINEHTSPGALLCLTCYWCMTALMLEYDCSKHYSEEAKNAFVQRSVRSLLSGLCRRQKNRSEARIPLRLFNAQERLHNYSVRRFLKRYSLKRTSAVPINQAPALHQKEHRLLLKERAKPKFRRKTSKSPTSLMPCSRA